MNKYIRPASFLIYLLMVVVFFFTGAFYAAMVGAAEGQGLAGGAIVLVYGVFFALAALVIAFLLVHFASRKIVKLINSLLFIALVALTLVFTYRFMGKQQEIENDPVSLQIPQILGFHTFT